MKYVILLTHLNGKYVHKKTRFRSVFTFDPPSSVGCCFNIKIRIFKDSLSQHTVDCRVQIHAVPEYCRVQIHAVPVYCRVQIRAVPVQCRVQIRAVLVYCSSALSQYTVHCSSALSQYNVQQSQICAVLQYNGECTSRSTLSHYYVECIFALS